VQTCALHFSPPPLARVACRGGAPAPRGLVGGVGGGVGVGRVGLVGRKRVLCPYLLDLPDLPGLPAPPGRNTRRSAFRTPPPRRGRPARSRTPEGPPDRTANLRHRRRDRCWRAASSPAPRWCAPPAGARAR